MSKTVFAPQGHDNWSMVWQKLQFSRSILGSKASWILQRNPLERIVLQILQKESSISLLEKLPFARVVACWATKAEISGSVPKSIEFPRSFCWYRLIAGWLMPKSFAASACFRLCLLVSSLATIARMDGKAHFTATSQGASYGLSPSLCMKWRGKYILLLS